MWLSILTESSIDASFRNAYTLRLEIAIEYDRSDNIDI